LAVQINLRQATREPALAHLPRLGRFGGPYTFLYLGVPFFLVMALASHLHWAPPWLELVATAMGGIGGVLVAILFMREWRVAVLHPGAAT
jgi:hypothetical protein